MNRIPEAIVPFSVEQGLAYLQNERGQLVRVHLKKEVSFQAWSALKPGMEIKTDVVGEELATCVRLLWQQSDRFHPPEQTKQVGLYRAEWIPELAFSLNHAGHSVNRFDQVNDKGPLAIQLAIYAVPRFHLTQLETASRYFECAHIPWLPIYSDGRLIRVGPLLGPYISFDSLKRRLLAASPDGAALSCLWNRLSQLEDDIPTPFSSAERSWTAAVATLLVQQWMAAPEHYRLIHTQFTLDPENLTITEHPVLRVPTTDRRVLL